ncbi:substrate-binding periplasmic protein [Maridesulfovibrio sp. FT414]|uniref:substrate-binding periplasmic protein n=1 Tax=Maridesulfovibrio sp. FT414 TaxID=2979469 RepID=UPI003D806F6D
MKGLLTIIFLCLSLLLSAGGTSVAADGQAVRFATEELPPFNYIQDGKISGPAVALVDSVCKKLGQECSIGLYPWRRAEAMTRSGQVQGLFSVGWNKPREEWLYFSTPVFSTEYGFFECQENPMVFSPIEKLKGKTIGVYGPSNLSYTLDQINKQLGGSLKIELFTENPALFKKLSRCRLDAVFCTKDVGLSTIDQMNLKNIRYAQMQKKVFYHVGFSRKGTTEEFYRKFNKVILEMKKNGELDRIARKYGVTPAH